MIWYNIKLISRSIMKYAKWVESWKNIVYPQKSAGFITYLFLTLQEIYNNLDHYEKTI